MFDPDYEKQELVGEEPGNPFEDKSAVAKAAAASADSNASSETKKDK